MINKTEDGKIWLVSINMGYGHQRTAYSLRDFAFGGKNINANDYDGISKKDRDIWEFSRKFYEAVSGFKNFPILGNLVFSLMDYFQRILNFYPKRDLSATTPQLEQNFNLIKNGWGKDLIEKLKSQNSKIPFVSTFFTPAFMAEYFGYPGEIFCIVCDTDISRAWAPLEPKKSRIKYFAPTERVAERLKLYGVRQENIFFTGYPLPRENIGGQDKGILKEDLKFRILNLDPQKKYFTKYETIIREKLGDLPEKSDHPLTLMFAVGGAGAQKEIPVKILKRLSDRIKKEEIKIILVAGTKERIKNGFIENIRDLKLEEFLNKGIDIIFEEKIGDYFEKFNLALRKTDILWTKPSELSFYSALGLPIIIAPPIGSQEDFNKRWLLKSGFGVSQENPDYLEDWLFDWIFSGYLAEAAMQAFIEGEQLGTLKIENIICGLQ
jgi:hypothetical protein